MNDFTLQRLYFFVTTIAVVLVTLFLSLFLIYLIGVLRDIKFITRKARNEADLIAGDLSELRKNIKESGAKLKFFINFFSGLYRKKKNNKH